MLGFHSVGYGSTKVVMLHDWVCDHTTYDAALPYFDQSVFTVVLPDLRGYGKSRQLEGFSLGQAVQDLKDLSDHLGLNQFSVVGHSMSAMMALKLAADLPGRVQKMALVSPVTHRGLELDDGTRGAFEAATSNYDAAKAIIGVVTGNRYGDGWLDFKAQRSFEAVSEQVKLGYLHNMLLSGAFKLEGLATPTLVITGSHDTDGFREDDAKALLGTALCKAEYVTVSEAGHYTMQEAPVRFASLVQSFLV